MKISLLFPPGIDEITIYRVHGEVLAMARSGPHVFATGRSVRAYTALEQLHLSLGMPWKPCACPETALAVGERIQLQRAWTSREVSHYLVWRETEQARGHPIRLQGETPGKALAALGGHQIDNMGTIARQPSRRRVHFAFGNGRTV